MDITNITSLPRGKTVEFKKDLSSIIPILETLIAFANTAGGTLLIGRDIDGTINGVDDIFASKENLANAISENIFPPLMQKIEIISFKGKALLLIRVAYGRGPFYLKAQGPEDGVYIRSGVTNRLAGPEFIAELKRSISNISFDQLPCPETDVSSLDMSRIEQAFSDAGRKINLQELETLGILVSFDGKLVCSNGGVILFGNDQIRNRHFPNARVRMARFKGVDNVDVSDQYDCPKAILEAMKEVPHFIQRNSTLNAKFDQIHQKEVQEDALIMIHEVLINALVHADYSIKGMNPRLNVFSNRLEIENPGMLPFGYTLNEFTSGVSHIRNKVIARVFRELHLMKEWGTGYKKIAEVCMNGGYQIPKWEEFGTAVRVTIMPYIATHDRRGQAMYLSDSENEMTLREWNILKLLQNKGPLSSKNIYKNLNEPISERSLRNNLLALKGAGRLKMIGNARSSVWSYNTYI